MSGVDAVMFQSIIQLSPCQIFLPQVQGETSHSIVFQPTGYSVSYTKRPPQMMNPNSLSEHTIYYMSVFYSFCSDNEVDVMFFANVFLCVCAVVCGWWKEAGHATPGTET